MLYLLWERGYVIVSNVDRYVIVRKFLNSVVNILFYSHIPLGNLYTYRGLFFRKVADTRRDVAWCVEWMDVPSRSGAAVYVCAPMCTRWEYKELVTKFCRKMVERQGLNISVSKSLFASSFIHV